MNKPTNKRVPVLSKDGKPLMPTKASRARRMIKEGKAKIVKNDLGIFQIQLTEEASGDDLQDISVGIDPGSCFTGIAVQSKNETLVGLNLNLPQRVISKRMTDRALCRKDRRCRRIKRNIPFNIRNHRQVRFSNRKKSKIPPSILASKQLELRVIKELVNIYPISDIYVEMMTTSKGRGFGITSTGQNWLISQLNVFITVNLVKGFETSNTRKFLGLLKSKNKAEQSPEAHANDAVSMSCRHFIEYQVSNLTNSGDWIGKVKVNKFDFIMVSRLGNRPRKLHQLTVNKEGKRITYGGLNKKHSYSDGDVVKYKTNKVFYIGVVSASDLYEIFPKRKRLVKDMKNKNSTLLYKNCNLLVNIIK